MAIVNIKIVDQCDGGGHYTLRFTKGARVLDVSNVTKDDFTAEISDEDLLAWARVTERLGSEGRTLNQIRNALLAGVDVTVTF